MSVFQRLFIYNLLLFVIFTSINFALKDEFQYTSPGDPQNWVSLAWYTFSNQTTIGAGDINPTSNRSRIISMAHLSLALAGSTYILLGTHASL
jgi:hypothetical protein